MRKRQKHKNRVYVGILLWIGFILYHLPFSNFSLTYVKVLLVAAPLFLVPMAWQLMELPSWVNKFALPAAVLFCISFLLEEGVLSASLVLPWLFLSVFVAFRQMIQWWDKRSWNIKALSTLAACGYLPIASVWAFSDRIGFELMGFSPTIVLLTAVHFHYAGFVLPLITGWVIEKEDSWIQKFIAWGVILGVPLVALGITTTQYQLPDWIEVVAVSILTTAAFGAAVLHIGKARKEIGLNRFLFVLSAFFLKAGMALAFCYGWRSVFTLSFLTIPWMYAVHGTFNAIGFALPALIAYYRTSNTSNSINRNDMSKI